jgi:hypothetical protein
MTTLELKLDLPDRLAREALAAGLFTPEAIKQLLQDAVRRRAGHELLAAADRVAAAQIPAMGMDEIQEEVNAVRSARKAGRSS